MRSPSFLASVRLTLAGGLAFAGAAWADGSKEQALTAPAAIATSASAAVKDVGGAGYRFWLTNAAARVQVVVVGGTPFQMGWQLGSLLREDIHRFVPATLSGFKQQLGITDEELDVIWASTAAFTDDRFEQELLGLAEGSGMPLRTMQHVHCLPLLMPYSCSALAAWGSATEDGHLYQTRNLDWSLEAGAHEFPVLAVYLPAAGQAHVLPTFAGVIGANCGLNAAGISLSEMGDASKQDAPYNIRAPHFTTWFRRILYDATSLSDTLRIFHEQPQTKRYHFVFGDGQKEKKAVKIVSNSLAAPPQNVMIWGDNDPKDELAPSVLPCVVYQDEGRGAFPGLKAERGKLNGERMLALAKQIPIKGGNVLIAVFDATAPRLWVSYAGGELEAYQRPAVFLDLAKLDGDGDGAPDVIEGSQDRDGNGKPDFLDPGAKVTR